MLQIKSKFIKLTNTAFRFHLIIKPSNTIYTIKNNSVCLFVMHFEFRQPIELKLGRVVGAVPKVQEHMQEQLVKVTWRSKVIQRSISLLNASLTIKIGQKSSWPNYNILPGSRVFQESARVNQRSICLEMAFGHQIGSEESLAISYKCIALFKGHAGVNQNSFYLEIPYGCHIWS